jgi:hypothetical protein
MGPSTGLTNGRSRDRRRNSSPTPPRFGRATVRCEPDRSWSQCGRERGRRNERSLRFRAPSCAQRDLALPVLLERHAGRGGLFPSSSDAEVVPLPRTNLRVRNRPVDRGGPAICRSRGRPLVGTRAPGGSPPMAEHRIDHGRVRRGGDAHRAGGALVRLGNGPEDRGRVARGQRGPPRSASGLRGACGSPTFEPPYGGA